MSTHPWEPSQLIEKKYFKSLTDIADFLQKSIEKEHDPYRIIWILRHTLIKPAFNRFAYEAARKMVTNLYVSNAKSWRHAASKSGKGRIIYEVLKQEMQGPVGSMINFQIQRNAELITTLPQDIAGRVTNYVQQESLKGRRASDIARDIQNMFPESSRAKASLIARTEVSKTSTALTRARAENIGIAWYEWVTSEDARVRSSHRIMDRVIVNWNDPPSPEKLLGMKNAPAPYHAGNIYNCRCFPAPVVNFSRLQWPHKVFTNGSITTMTKAQFEKLARIAA